MALKSAEDEKFFVTVDYDIVNEEFKNFIKFVKSISSAVKKDISNFLYPFYVYIFLILLQRNLIKEGKKFVSTYAPLFTSTPGYASVVKTLREFNHIQEFKSHSYFRQFWESKYVINTTEETESLSLMRCFFEENRSNILLLIFRHHLIIKGKSFSDASFWDSNCVAKYCESDLKVQESDVDKFKNVLELMKGNLSKPVSQGYQISSGKKNLCAADVNINNSQLICGFENSEIHHWNLSTDFFKVKTAKDASFVSLDSNLLGEFLACDISVKRVSKLSSNKVLRGHSGPIYGLRTICDNCILLSCSEDGTAIAWNLEDFQKLDIYSGHDHPIWNIALSSDSRFFATASKDARMWSFENHQPLRIFASNSEDFDCVTFHPNSKYIATASTNKNIQLWTTEDAREVRSFFGHKDFINSLVFSPNGRHLASGDTGGFVKIWDLGSGHIIKEFKAHSNHIFSMAYNRSGTLLATGSLDTHLKVWDARFPTATNSPEKNVSKRRNEKHPKLISSYFNKSPVHYVRFCDKDLLVSVSSLGNSDSS